jgi:flagellar basal-body rod protein FlgB
VIHTIFNKGALPVAEQILYFTRVRHTAIAANIANAETPFYKAQDAPEADFREALDRALEGRGKRPVPVVEMLKYGHVRPKIGGGIEGDFISSAQGRMLKHNENNVEGLKDIVSLIGNNLGAPGVCGITRHLLLTKPGGGGEA